MRALALARIVADLERSADLMLKAAEALCGRDCAYDPGRELETARRLHIKALSLRLLLETEVREKGTH